MNSKDYLSKNLNIARLKMAIERGELIRDNDDIYKITHPQTLRQWQPTVPMRTKYWALKDRNNL